MENRLEQAARVGRSLRKLRKEFEEQFQGGRSVQMLCVEKNPVESKSRREFWQTRDTGFGNYGRPFATLPQTAGRKGKCLEESVIRKRDVAIQTVCDSQTQTEVSQSVLKRNDITDVETAEGSLKVQNKTELRISPDGSIDILVHPENDEDFENCIGLSPEQKNVSNCLASFAENQLRFLEEQVLEKHLELERFFKPVKR